MTGYADAERLYNAIGARIAGGGEAKIKGPTLANIPVHDTELSAILATLGIGMREPVPFTDSIDERTGRRVRSFWFADRSESGHITEDILGGYYNRERMASEHPIHPLIPMRAALDARKFWVAALKERGRLPTEGQGFKTDSLRTAAILVGCNFRPIAFSGRAFIIEPTNQGVPAQAILEISERFEGQAAPQWMRKVLINLDEFLAHINKGKPIIRVQDGARSMLLSADATPKTVALFENLL